MAIQNLVSFTDTQLKLLTNSTSKKICKRGVDLCHEPDVDTGFYVVKEGRVKVSVLTEDGRSYTLFIFKPGDMFSMFSFLRTPNCEVTIVDDAVLEFLSQKHLESLFYEEPSLASTYMNWYDTMNSGTIMKMRDLLMYGKRGALASTLIRLMNTYGEDVSDGIRIGIKVTNEDLSKLIGSSRESVNRLLRKYQDLDVIRYDKRHIVVKNRSYLEQEHFCNRCPKEICHI